ncbi:MAG: EcsC family protein [Propionibacteriales bacterium]|nr:EcsC family protein [Propionibacteriales bacterium]
MSKPTDDGLVLRTAHKVVQMGRTGGGPFKSAQAVAHECLLAANGDVEEAVRRAIKIHVRYATTAGGATGLGGVAALPLQLSAGLASSYVINARMTQTIAHLRGYDVDSDEVQTVVLATLLGSSGAAAVQKTGIEIGNKTLLAAVHKVPGRVLIDINKKVGYRLFTKAGEKGVVNLTKLVPFVGAPIGATAENLTTRTISRYALRNFPARPQPGM